MITLLTLLVQFQSYAADHVYSKVNPAIAERTASSSEKIKVNLPVDFEKTVCTQEETRTGYRCIQQWVPCGYGRYYRSCYMGCVNYPYQYTECVRHELRPFTETREIVLKFKKGTELSSNQAERYSVKVNQRAPDSSALYTTVDSTNTVREYDVKFSSRGRRAVFRIKK